MNKNIKSMYKDIINNRNLQEHIPDFLENTASQYNTYAAVRLAMHYYTYYEMYLDEKDNWGTQLSEYIKSINAIISEAVLENKDCKDVNEYIRQVDDIRGDITARMEMIASGVSLFGIYEYALNRVEYRFRETGSMVGDEEFAREVLNYIFDSEDNVLINEKIKEIIGQLPVRITKQKYFEYINESFMELDGAQEDILETYIYMIRSSAGLDITEDMKDVYPDLWEKKEKLERLDLKNITKEEYEDAAAIIKIVAAFLEVESTAYYSLAEIINELYTLLISSTYQAKDTSENKKQMEAALFIIQKINEKFLDSMNEEPDQDILSSFEILEGFQESIEFDLISFEDVLYHLDKQHRDLVKDKEKEELLDILLLSMKLLSGSLFIELHKAKSNEIVDKRQLRKEIDNLINDLTDKFIGSDRMIMRAIIAHTINKLPVFFNTHTEVMEYVLYALGKCTDLAEKYACMEIIESIMDE